MCYIFLGVYCLSHAAHLVLRLFYLDCYITMRQQRHDGNANNDTSKANFCAL